MNAFGTIHNYTLHICLFLFTQKKYDLKYLHNIIINIINSKKKLNDTPDGVSPNTPLRSFIINCYIIS